jgi:putative flippase GtrA
LLWDLSRKYIKFIIVAAVLGIVSMMLLELLHWTFDYTSATVHGILSTLIYLAGLAVNFQLQKRWVFETDRQASPVLYTAWMLFSSMVVGLLSGVLFELLARYWPTLPFASSISLAGSLAINSPITFLGVSIIMRGHKRES